MQGGVRSNDRRFYKIDIFEQEAKEIASKFIDFLYRENVKTGEAIKIAKRVFKNSQEYKILNENLPKAWNELISNTDDELIKLIGEATEKICGCKPSDEMVKEFLSNNTSKLLIFDNELMPIKPKPPNSFIRPKPKPPINSSIAFYFRNEKYDVRIRKDILMKLCTILYKLHPYDFEKILDLKGKKFSKNPNYFFYPKQIEGTDIYAETNLSTNGIIKRCNDLLKLFGYSEKDFRIETK